MARQDLHKSRSPYYCRLERKINSDYMNCLNSKMGVTPSFDLSKQATISNQTTSNLTIQETHCVEGGSVSTNTILIPQSSLVLTSRSIRVSDSHGVIIAWGDYTDGPRSETEGNFYKTGTRQVGGYQIECTKHPITQQAIYVVTDLKVD